LSLVNNFDPSDLNFVENLDANMKLMQKSIFCKYVRIYQTIHYDLTEKRKKRKRKKR